MGKIVQPKAREPTTDQHSRLEFSICIKLVSNKRSNIFNSIALTLYSDALTNMKSPFFQVLQNNRTSRTISPSTKTWTNLKICSGSDHLGARIQLTGSRMDGWLQAFASIETHLRLSTCVPILTLNWKGIGLGFRGTWQSTSSNAPTNHPSPPHGEIETVLSQGDTLHLAPTHLLGTISPPPMPTCPVEPASKSNPKLHIHQA